MRQLPDVCPGGKRSPCSPAVIADKLPADGRIVEIGSGSGVLLSYLIKAGFRDVIGIEPEPGAAYEAGLPVLAGRAEALPLPDACCAAAVMECVFSLCEPGPSVRELARVLLPGGIAVIADLFSETEGRVLGGSPMVRRVLPREELCAPFRERFTLESYEDHTPALRNMFLQMVFQGNTCSFLAPSDLGELKKIKAGYGLWIWKKC